MTPLGKQKHRFESSLGYHGGQNDSRDMKLNEIQNRIESGVEKIFLHDQKNDYNL